MKKYVIAWVFTLLLSLCSQNMTGQELKGVYVALEESFGEVLTHELKFSESYVTYSVYQADPAFFIRTMGGFYEVNDDTLLIVLEFNSDFERDPESTKTWKYQLEGQNLILDDNEDRIYEKLVQIRQELDGTWLFGTRGPDIGQDRRGDSRSRKTLKFLVDGRFQWVAYDVADFRFLGSGGGNYTARDGKYSEQIEYFSRDNKRAGATLDFIYTLHEDDWHHIGNNSRGEPMYEIWMRRTR